MTEDESRKTRSIETSIEIDAPIEAVWKALTEASELVRWFPLEAGEEPDGTLWMSFGEGTRFAGKADVSEPPHRVRFVYRQPPPGRDPSTLSPEDLVEIATEYTLETERGKTVLRLVHSGFGEDDSWNDLFDATRLGWAFELRGLKHYLEKHRGEDRRVAWARRPYEGDRAAAWKRLGEGWLDGLIAEGDYAVEAPTGDRLEGRVLWLEPPTSFVATVTGLDDALLRVKLEDLYGMKEANVWLSSYGVPPGEVEAFETRWQAWLDGLFTG